MGYLGCWKMPIYIPRNNRVKLPYVRNALEVHSSMVNWSGCKLGLLGVIPCLPGPTVRVEGTAFVHPNRSLCCLFVRLS